MVKLSYFYTVKDYFWHGFHGLRCYDFYSLKKSVLDFLRHSIHSGFKAIGGCLDVEKFSDKE